MKHNNSNNIIVYNYSKPIQFNDLNFFFNYKNIKSVTQIDISCLISSLVKYDTGIFAPTNGRIDFNVNDGYYTLETSPDYEDILKNSVGRNNRNALHNYDRNKPFTQPVGTYNTSITFDSTITVKKVSILNLIKPLDIKGLGCKVILNKIIFTINGGKR